MRLIDILEEAYEPKDWVVITYNDKVEYMGSIDCIYPHLLLRKVSEVETKVGYTILSLTGEAS